MSDLDGNSEDLPQSGRSSTATASLTPEPQFIPARLPWRLLTPISIALLIMMAFVPALSAGFVHWDDDDLLLTETVYRQVDEASLRWMFTTSYAGHFQPLTWLTYSLDYQIFGQGAFGYHLTNVLLHLLTALGFYYVSRRLLAAGFGSPEAYRSGKVVLAAAFATTLFAIHPLRAESVAWIAERRDVLSGLFYVLTVLAYLRYVGTDGADRFVIRSHWRQGQRWANYLAATTFCLLSLLAKASAVMLPFVLLVLDVYPLRRMRLGREGIRARRTVWLDKLPFLVLGLAAGVRAVMAQAESGALYPLAEHGPLARLAQAAYGLVFYLWKTVWPTDLGPLYPIPTQEVLFGRMLWTSIAVLAILLVVALKTYRRWPALSVALAIYVVQVLPVLGLAQSGPQLVADRYSYLSCLGLAVLGGAVMLKWLRRSTAGRNEAVSGLATVAGFGLVITLTHATFAQNEVWDTPLSLWMQGVRVSPRSSIANVNLADAIAENGYPQQAIRFYQTGLALDPTDQIAASHLGQALERAGDVPRAIQMYQLAVTLDPTRSADYLRLAHLLIATDRAVEAAGLLRRRATDAPRDLRIMAYLADLLATYPDEEVRDGPEAVRWATHLSRAHNGMDAVAQLYLCTALAEAGRFEDAIRIAEAALAMPTVRDDSRLAAELQRRAELFRHRRTYLQGEEVNRPAVDPG